jgi:ubiquitin conjugation factor E4 B
MEHISDYSHERGATPKLHYLGSCYRRVANELRDPKQEEEAKQNLRAAAEECIVTELTALLTAGATTRAVSLALLQNLMSSSNRLPPALFTAAVGRLGGTEAVWQAFSGLFIELMKQLRATGLASETPPLPLMQCFATLVAAPAVAKAVVENAQRATAWVPAAQPNLMRRGVMSVSGNTLQDCGIGPLFVINCVPDVARQLRRPQLGQNPFAPGVLGRHYFPSGLVRKRQAEVELELERVRFDIRLMQEQLVKVTKAMLRKDPPGEIGTREATLSWLAVAVECNSNRAKEYSDHSLDASDNFMLNLAFVLLKLCEPFLDGKVAATIQSEYSVRSARYLETGGEEPMKCTFDKETKFAVTSGELDAWVDNGAPQAEGPRVFLTPLTIFLPLSIRF